jgi:hypothetical protein
MTDDPSTYVTGAGEAVFAYLSPDQLAAGEGGGGGGGCDCGITDSFARTVAIGWGTSDAGIAWNGATTGASVNGTAGVLVCNATFQTRSIALTPPPFIGLPIDVYFDLDLDNPPPSAFPQPRFAVVMGGDATNFRLDLLPSQTPNITIANGDFSGSPEATSLGITNALSVHIRKETNGTDTTFRANVWPIGNTEPAGWLVYDTKAGSVDNETDFVLQLNQTSTNTGFTASVSNLRIFMNGTQVDRCTEFRFDNFNRTVTSGWGTSDYGRAWGSSAGSVDGSQAVLPRASPGGGGQIQPPADIIDALMLFKTPSWPTGIARWIVTPIPGSSAVTGQNNVLLFFSEGFGLSVYREGVEVNVSHGWAQTTWYYIRIHADLAGCQVKVWAAGTAEPTSWTASNSTPIPSGSNTPFFSIGTGGFNGTGSSGLIDWLDFDYTGKPCYQDCPADEIIYDDFNRSTSGGWGSASSAGAWTNTTPPAGSDISTSTSGGGQGIIDIHPAVASGGHIQVTNATIPPVDGFTVEAQFSFSTDGSIPNYPALQVLFGAITVEIRFGSTGKILIGSNEYSISSWSQFTFYRLKVMYEPLLGYLAKVWKQSDPEPAWQVATTTITAPTTFGFDVVKNYSGGTEFFEVVVYDIWVGSACTNVEAGGGIPEPSEDNPATWAPIVTGSGTYGVLES